MQLADDLVQDTLLKAWGNSEKFEPGTSLRAWLFTILRNTYYSLYRKRGREVQDSEGTYAERLATHGNQESHLDLADFRKALAKLPEEQREVLIMVGATGLSYEETAEICGVAIGTIKSRVNRARTKLAELLSIGGVDDLGPGSQEHGRHAKERLGNRRPLMRLASFRTVRGRLLALLIGIALPIACLTAMTAMTTYQTVTSGIETAQKRTGDDYAIRTRVWYRGVLRSLLASGSTLAREGDAGRRICSSRRRARARPGARLSRALRHQRRQPDLHRLRRPGDRSRRAGPGHGGIARQAGWSRSGPGRMLSPRPLRFRRSSADAGISPSTPATTNRASRSAKACFSSIRTCSHQVFNFGEGESGPAGGAGERRVRRRRRPRRAAAAAWTGCRRRTSCPPRRGAGRRRAAAARSRIYTARMVAEPDLYVIASFDTTLERAARTQFLVLLLAPLLTLVLLCLVYLRAIDRHCIHWLRNIEAAARARTTLSTARAVVAPDMPFDIRSVAEAFNTMVDEQEVRQRRLQTALDDNRFLVRELHHRVKNSLQVVQSYIGLTKRDYRGEARHGAGRRRMPRPRALGRLSLHPRRWRDAAGPGRAVHRGCRDDDRQSARSARQLAVEPRSRRRRSLLGRPHHPARLPDRRRRVARRCAARRA